MGMADLAVRAMEGTVLEGLEVVVTEDLAVEVMGDLAVEVLEDLTPVGSEVPVLVESEEEEQEATK